MSPERISRLSIAGFKSIKSAAVDFGDVNVLIGPNGCGKTNLLSFFKMLRAIASESFQDFVGRSGSADMLLHYGAKSTKEISASVGLRRPSPEGEQHDETYHLRCAYAIPDRLLLIDQDQLVEETDWQRSEVESSWQKTRESFFGTSPADPA